MTETAAVEVCAGTIVGGKGDLRALWGSYVWPCVLAAGHEGECRPRSEAKDFPVPFAERDRDWLLAQVTIYYVQIESMRRDHRRARELQDAQHRESLELMALAYRHGNGTGGKHGALCWLKHPFCLARAVLVHSWGERARYEAKEAGLT